MGNMANLNTIDLRNKNTGEVKKVPQFLLANYPEKIEELMGQGFIPSTQLDANELNKHGYNVEQVGGYDDIYGYGGIDRAQLKGAERATEEIMKDYRDFGADNPYMDQDYGANNPYLDKSMENIGKLEDMAYSGKMTPYAEAMLDEQDIMKKMSGENVRRTGAGNQANAFSNLAMKGGLDGGARERVEMAGAENNMNAMQNVYAQDELARNRIIGNDIGYRQDLASKMPGMYNPYAQGAESWRQTKATGKEAYETEREKLRMGTIGNIYGGNDA